MPDEYIAYFRVSTQRQGQSGLGLDAQRTATSQFCETTGGIVRNSYTEIESGMKDIEARIEKDMDPFVAARQMDTDEVIKMSTLRPWLSALVEMSYQSNGHRRLKNPRIWSVHDLDVLSGGKPL